MSEVKITVRPNGPYRVEGPIVLLDTEGNQFDLSGRGTIVLCRCGASSNKPFCDATHRKIGFEATSEAVQESDKPS